MSVVLPFPAQPVIRALRIPHEKAIGLLPDFDNTTDPTCALFTFQRSDDAEADPNTMIEVEYGGDLTG